MRWITSFRIQVVRHFSLDALSLCTARPIAVLKHIAEVEERRLYLEEGYSSMFSYLREKFNYSESAAWRRLTAARALRQFPQVCESLACRAINLSTLCQIAKSLTCANCEGLLTAVKGKSKDEVSRILVELALPAPGVPSVQRAKAKRDKVKLLAVQKNAPKAVVPDLFSWNRNEGPCLCERRWLLLFCW